nr:SDR family NAD(P)-dependent oxidoreductase [Methylobacterium aquaticum]
MYDFSGSTLLLTGAAGGIGKETARMFLSGGANVVLADVDLERTEAARLEIGQIDRSLSVAYDAGSPDRADAAILATTDPSARSTSSLPRRGSTPITPSAR